MQYGYHYTHSDIGADGKEYITFMPYPEGLDSHGMRNGKAINIDIDHVRQTTTVSQFYWIGGAPHNFERICTIKDEVIDSDNEIPNLMERLGIEVGGGEENETP